MNIVILGSGCKKCNTVESLVREVVKDTGVTASIEKVTDAMGIASYGVFGTPAVVVDGSVKSVGKIPSRDEVESWLKGN